MKKEISQENTIIEKHFKTSFLFLVFLVHFENNVDRLTILYT